MKKDELNITTKRLTLGLYRNFITINLVFL